MAVSRRKNLWATIGERGFLAFSRRAGRGKNRPPPGVEKRMLIFESKAGVRRFIRGLQTGARFCAGIPFGSKPFVIGSDACQ